MSFFLIREQQCFGACSGSIIDTTVAPGSDQLTLFCQRGMSKINMIVAEQEEDRDLAGSFPRCGTVLTLLSFSAIVVVPRLSH